MVEEVGSMVIVGKVDNNQVMLEMDKLKRAMRSAETETSRFAGSFDRLAGISVGVAGGVAGLVTGLLNLSKVGPNTSIGLSNLETTLERVGMTIDQSFIGKGFRKVTEELAKQDPRDLAALGISGFLGGIFGGAVGGALGGFGLLGPIGALGGGILGGILGGGAALVGAGVGIAGRGAGGVDTAETGTNLVSDQYGGRRVDGVPIIDARTGEVPSAFYANNVTINSDGVSYLNPNVLSTGGG